MMDVAALPRSAQLIATFASTRLEYVPSARRPVRLSASASMPEASPLNAAVSASFSRGQLRGLYSAAASPVAARVRVSSRPPAVSGVCSSPFSHVSSFFSAPDDVPDDEEPSAQPDFLTQSAINEFR